MTTRSQFCPVAKAAEVFADRWTPIIIRELCFGTRSFGELLRAAPPISRTMLAQRLKQLEQSGVVHIEPKSSGKGHFYRLSAAGEDFRSIIELLSAWGQRWGQGLLGPDDLDPQELVWSMRRQIDPADIPTQGLVIRFDFRGLPKSSRNPRYWWLLVRPDDIEVCLKAPARDTDVVIAADLMTFTKVWLGYVGLTAALESGKISLNGPARAISLARRLLALSGQPTLKTFRFSPFPTSDTLAAQAGAGERIPQALPQGLFFLPIQVAGAANAFEQDMIEKGNTHFERPQAAEAALKGEEMPKAYIVVNAARRADMPASAAYLDRFRESLAHHGGRVLIGAEEIDRREGQLSLGRLVIVEFVDNAFPSKP